MWTGGENACVDASSEPIILAENLPICIEANGSGASCRRFPIAWESPSAFARTSSTAAVFCVVLGIVTTGHIVGVGVGTILAVIGVGRFMALYNYLFAEPTMRLAGMPTNA